MVDSIVKNDRTTTNKNALESFFRTSPRKDVETKHAHYLAKVGGEKKRQALKDKSRLSNNSPFDSLKYF